MVPEHPPPKNKKLFPESKSGLTQNTPPPQNENSNFLSWVQIWAYPEPRPLHPWKWKTLTFFPEFRSELTQNLPPPPKMKNSNFLSWVQIWAYPEHPPQWKTNFLSWVQIWAYPEHLPPPMVVEVCGDHIPQGYHLVLFFENKVSFGKNWELLTYNKNAFQ